MTKSAHSRRYTFFKGRVALHAILRAAGIGPGDQVLLPGYTCVVVPNAILYLGAEPVYLDIDARTFNVDPHHLAHWLESHRKHRARALILQHTYGIPCDLDAITPLAQQGKLLVIEDSCHAIGSTYKGRRVGTLGDAAFFSSQWSKPVTTGLGGWATVQDSALKSNLEAILSHYTEPNLYQALVLRLQYLAFKVVDHPRLFWFIRGLYRKLGDLGLAIGSSTPTELACKEPAGYMKCMSRLQERQLDKHLQDVATFIRCRKYQQTLVEELLEAEGLAGLDLDPGLDPVVLRYPLRVKNKAQVLSLALRKRIQLGDWFLSPIHPNSDRWELAGYQPGTCPVAETVSATTINIPLGPQVSDKELERTVAFLGRVAEPC